MAALDITSEIVGAGATASGLVLVFLGATAASYAAHQPQERRSVRRKFQIRASFAFGALFVCVSSVFFALVADWTRSSGLAMAAFGCLVVGMVAVIVTAYLSIKENF